MYHFKIKKISFFLFLHFSISTIIIYAMKEEAMEMEFHIPSKGSAETLLSNLSAYLPVSARQEAKKSEIIHSSKKTEMVRSSSLDKKGDSRLKLKPTTILNIFDIRRDLKIGNYLKKLMASNLIISPSKQELIIGTKGKVYLLPFSGNTLELLFTHHNIKKAPIITAVQPGKYLKICSAGNYCNSNSNNWYSNIVIYQDGWTKRPNEFNFPIQAIQFDSQGEFLIIGGRASVHIFNIINNTIQNVIFRPAISHTPNYIMDLAIHKDDRNVIVIAKNNIMQRMYIDNKNALIKLPENSCELNIQNIRYPNDQMFFAHIRPDTTKIINVHNLIEANTPIVPSYTIATAKGYEQVTLNDKEISSAHWTKNPDASKNKRHSIKIFRSSNVQFEDNTIKQELEKIILLASEGNSKYTTTSNSGRLEEYNEHFFEVAYSDNYVVALNSGGEIFIWKLPEQKQSIENKVSSLESQIPSLERRRSKSLEQPKIPSSQGTTTTTTTSSPPSRPSKPQYISLQSMISSDGKPPIIKSKSASNSPRGKLTEKYSLSKITSITPRVVKEEKK